MRHSIYWLDSLLWAIDQHLLQQIHCLQVYFALEQLIKLFSQPKHFPFKIHLTQLKGLDIRKLELLIFGVHCFDLLYRRCSQHLDDLDQLVYGGFTREKRFS